MALMIVAMLSLELAGMAAVVVMWMKICRDVGRQQADEAFQ
jgi:hypothetical protein